MYVYSSISDKERVSIFKHRGGSLLNVVLLRPGISQRIAQPRVHLRTVAAALRHPAHLTGRLLAQRAHFTHARRLMHGLTRVKRTAGAGMARKLQRPVATDNMHVGQFAQIVEESVGTILEYRGLENIESKSKRFAFG